MRDSEKTKYFITELSVKLHEEYARRAGSPARLRRRPHAAKIAGSNPARPTKMFLL